MPRPERPSSQVGVVGALRARDVSRSRPGDEQAAEEVVASVLEESRRRPRRPRGPRGRDDSRQSAGEGTGGSSPEPS